MMLLRRCFFIIIFIGAFLSFFIFLATPIQGPIFTTRLTREQYGHLRRRGVISRHLLGGPLNYSITAADQFCADVDYDLNHPGRSNYPQGRPQGTVSDGGKSYYFFVMIISSWPNTEQREEIRKTWATYRWFSDAPGLNYTYRFILSHPSEEQLANATQPTDLDRDDIITTYFTEHYYLLDMKVMWAFSDVLSRFRFQYLVKCDDDTFVNLYRLPPKIQAAGVYGPYFYGGHPLSTHHWTGTPIKYAAGSGYVLSRPALCAVVYAHAAYSLTGNRIPIEDAYTGFLASHMGITLKFLPGFAMEHESCKDFTTVIFHHLDHKLFSKLLRVAVNGTRFC